MFLLLGINRCGTHLLLGIQIFLGYSQHVAADNVVVQVGYVESVVLLNDLLLV